MSRYIDADEIRWVDHYDSDGNLSKYKVAFSDEMPPTVDAVPVIRCKDCKYKDDGIDEDGIPFLKCLNGRSYGGTRINDYCSWAERREE